ncbi:MAG: DUF2147 domain-containing protein [Bacteroidales bacterium]
MVKQFLFPLLLIISQTLVQAQNLEDDAVGVWMNEDETVKVEITKNESVLSGKIVWTYKAHDSNGNLLLDRKNPDPQKRNQPILGLTIINGLKYSNGKWSGGTIYAPRRGQLADCTLELSGDKLIVTVSTKGFSRSKVWTRQ